MKLLKRVDVMSLAKLYTYMMGLFGLITGVIVAAASLMGGSMTQGTKGVGTFGGVLAIIVTPLLYAGMGFICGAIGGLVMNFVLKLTGGLKIEIVDESSVPVTQA